MRYDKVIYIYIYIYIYIVIFLEASCLLSIIYQILILRFVVDITYYDS